MKKWPLAALSRDLNIVFIPKSRDQDFWTFMRQGVDKAAREEGGVKLTWRGPAYNDDIDSQIDILRLYSRADVDAVIIVPTDRVRLMEPVRKAALLNGHGTVLVMRTIPGSASTEDRANGFVNNLAKHAPHLTIIDEYGGGTRGKIARAGLAALTKHKQIDGIFAVNESASDGMLRALRQTGEAGKKKPGKPSAVRDPVPAGALAADRRQVGTRQKVYNVAFSA